MGELKKWLKQDWVRIGTDGSIKGKCGTSKDKKTQTVAYQSSKARSLSKAERASTAQRKKKAGAKAKQWYQIQKPAKVRNLLKRRAS